MTTASNPAQQERAEAMFKKKELRAVEGRQAMQEYEAGVAAERAKTVRLRELRLSRDADAAILPPPAAKTSASKSSARKTSASKPSVRKSSAKALKRSA